MKKANPLEIAQYAAANHIDTRPIFAWWVPQTLKQRDRIIKQVTH